jgi:hypothetical protein
LIEQKILFLNKIKKSEKKIVGLTGRTGRAEDETEGSSVTEISSKTLI